MGIFFEPLSEFSLEEVHHSGNYILSGLLHKKVQDKLKLIEQTKIGDRSVIKHRNRLYKKYIRLNPKMKKFERQYIFWAVEDENIQETFVKGFGTCLISTNCSLGKSDYYSVDLSSADVTARDVGCVYSGINFLMKIML